MIPAPRVSKKNETVKAYTIKSASAFRGRTIKVAQTPVVEIYKNQRRSPVQRPVEKLVEPKHERLHTDVEATKFSQNKFRNYELEEKTASIQAEFDRILKTSKTTARNSPRERSSLKDDLKMDEFYKIMGEFYSGDVKRHKSPTKRLIQQKDSTVLHKQVLQNHHT